MIWLAALLFWAPAPTLFDQSVVRILTRDFPAARFVLMDVDSGQMLGRNWAADTPVPVGSLWKPFTAFAMGEHPGRARCHPQQCWLPAGHGELDLPAAIAASCNSYFLQQSAGLSREAIVRTSTRFQLPLPENETPAVLIGLGSSWKVAPLQMASAYAALARDEHAGGILEGMRRSALSGTAALLAGKALAKTGTAPCSHDRKASGDGYVAILYPKHRPRYVLLVQVHGVPGAEAARTGARMLDVLRDGK